MNLSHSTDHSSLRGVILAAGLGLRLRPLTGEIPKPLLPVAGRPIITLTLDRLVRVGCEAVAINLHHLGRKIRAAIGAKYRDMSIAYFEEPEILGTLGALSPMRQFLSSAGLVIVVNGDSLCRWPVTRLIERHRATGACATLLLAKRLDPTKLGGGVGVDRNGRIVQMRDSPAFGPVARRQVFAGMHVFRPDVLSGVSEGPADIVESLYLPLLERGERVGSFATAALWHDLGTPERYLEGALAWVAGRPGGSWISPAADISPQASITRSIVEAGCRIEAGANLDRSVVLSGAVVGAGSRLQSVLLGPDVAIAPGSTIEEEMRVCEADPIGLR